MRIVCTLLIAIFFLTGCNDDDLNEVCEDDSMGTLVQVSVIDALLQGLYDGYYPIGDLLEHGNYGIGTFHQLDGEMVVFNDTVFQVKSTGEVLMPDADILTPFAAVTQFQSDTLFNLIDFSFDDLETNFDTFFPTPNIFYMVKLKGKFSTVKTRSVPAQSKPYPALTVVTADQPEFGFENVEGDIIGFYCPAYASGINVTGLHLHFLNSDRSGGGHLLEFEMTEGVMQIGYLLDYRLILPPGGDFYGGDFTIDRSDDQEEAES